MLARNKILIFMILFFSCLSSGAAEVCYNILGVKERISRKNIQFMLVKNYISDSISGSTDSGT